LKALITPGHSSEFIRSGVDFPEAEIVNFPFPFSKEMNVPDKIFVMPVWIIKIAGLFVLVLKEMPEMMYQYDRDYFFDSSKFEKRFKFVPTTYKEGVKLTVQNPT